LFKNILHKELEFSHNNVSEDVRDLLIRLLDKNPLSRLGTQNGAEEVKSHSWFKVLNWDDVYNR